ncbi:MAG: dihydrolipoyl dehydrogenase [Thermodesulfobacteriota bacterium]
MAQDNQFDLIIIGSGPGGYVAAARAAQLGMKTACVEKDERLGGVCLNVGCIPSKALLDSSEHYLQAREVFADHGVEVENVGLNLAKMMERKRQVVEDLTGQVRQLLENNKVEIIRGTGKLTGTDEVSVETPDGETRTLKAKNILLATGSQPISVPGMEFDRDRIVSSTGALSFEEVPGKLGIVGGGYIGLELGSVWKRLGAEVTVIEMTDKIAGTMDGQVIRTLQRILKAQGLEFRLKTKVKSAEVKDDKVVATLEDEDGETTEEFDRLLVAVGRRPLSKDLGLEEVGVETDPKTGHVQVDHYLRTRVSNIYAIGDLVAGPALAHKASTEGIAAVEHMAGEPSEVNYDAIPSVVYTWPEVAGVGITEEQAKQREIPYCIGSYPFSGTGRARCMGEKDGFVKLICHSRTDRILGVHIIGPRASDMIAEAVLALEFGAASEDIARTIHGHPTFAEALMEAAMSARQCSIYTS